MVFSSLFFLYFFLPLCVICYAATKKIHHRNMVLLIFSLAFYAWGEPLYVFLLVASAAINYISALHIHKHRKRQLSSVITGATITFDIAMLVIFKYSGFIVENINAVTGLDMAVPKIRLPIGISFFTFQMLSYIIDCRWGKVRVQRSFTKFLMYVSLFPQLIAGPIVRYSTIESEISMRRTTADDLYAGISRMAVGLGKKVILANNLSTIVSSIFEAELNTISVTGTWLGAVLYALQIYFDFSGYSDMAIGLGRIFGFRFDENFNYPFICKDVSEFWQRWHISLSTFFRDYLLYVPIFGKRRKYAGLFLVWLCTGLWHGASWNYVIWGLYFGLFIFIELKIGKKKMKKIPIVVRHIYNKIVIVIGFGIFYFEDMGRLGEFFKNLIGLNRNGFTDEFTKLAFSNNAYLIIAAVICSFPLLKLVDKAVKKSDTAAYAVEFTKIVANLALILTSSIMLVDATNNPFLYFRF